MQRLQTQVKARLEAALEGMNTEVFYAYPQRWAALGTAVSFVESENLCLQAAFPPQSAPEADAQDAYPYEAMQRVVYTVDVWGTDPDEVWAVFAQINRAMTGIGFTRESSGDLYETQTRLHHRTSRYAAQVNLIQNEIG